MKEFFFKHQKAILLFAAFLAVCIIAGTIYHGEIENITLN